MDARVIDILHEAMIEKLMQGHLMRMFSEKTLEKYEVSPSEMKELLEAFQEELDKWLEAAQKEWRIVGRKIVSEGIEGYKRCHAKMVVVLPTMVDFMLRQLIIMDGEEVSILEDKERYKSGVLAVIGKSQKTIVSKSDADKMVWLIDKYGGDGSVVDDVLESAMMDILERYESRGSLRREDYDEWEEWLFKSYE